MLWKFGKWIWGKIQHHKDEKAAAIVAEAREKQIAEKAETPEKDLSTS